MTKRNSSGAVIPWASTPGITSPASSDLTIVAVTGQTTYIGEAGESVVINGDISADNLLTKIVVNNDVVVTHSDEVVWTT